MDDNYFQDAATVKKCVKIFITGPSGGGKTPGALSAPKPVVIDTEHGTDLYAGHIPFKVRYALTSKELEEAIDKIKNNSGDRETFILDSITPIYDTVVEAARKAISKNSGVEVERLNPRDVYSLANLRMNYLANKLVMLPMHVIVTARESDKWQNERVIGVKADAFKGVEYYFDIVLHVDEAHKVTVKRVRGGYDLKIDDIRKLWDSVKHIAADHAQGIEAAALPGPEEAAEIDAEQFAHKRGLSKAEAGELIARYEDYFESQGTTAKWIAAVIGPAAKWNKGFDAAVDRLDAEIKVMEAANAEAQQ